MLSPLQVCPRPPFDHTTFEATATPPQLLQLGWHLSILGSQREASWPATATILGWPAAAIRLLKDSLDTYAGPTSEAQPVSPC